MRNLRRDQTTIYYSLYQKDAKTDKYGNKIGGYTEPTKLDISLSVVSGQTENNIFGKNVDYDREMSTTDINCPIDEYSKLWVGIDTSKPSNYTVIKVATSKRQKRYAIKEVKSSTK